jgi:hypothetical protein
MLYAFAYVLPMTNANFDSQRFLKACRAKAFTIGSGIDKDRSNCTVYCGEWEVGRIYQTRGDPDNLRWFWSLTVNGPTTRADRVATLEEVKTQFQKR